MPNNPDALSRVDDTRTEVIDIPSPRQIIQVSPLNEDDISFIASTRKQVSNIIHGTDNRLLVISGPCSIHDPDAAMEYAKYLKKERDRLQGELEVVMRVYFEKPRTTVGWKGLINDPYLDDTNQIQEGLILARQLLRKIVRLGLPVAVEFLDVISPQYIGDLVTWGAIGARTTESQVHRELASGLSASIGFKNGTDGNEQIAIDAIKSARSPHSFLSISKEGRPAIVHSQGNPDTHIILRGGSQGPNYDSVSVARVVEKLTGAKVNNHVMIDLSHANSQKKALNQVPAGENVSEQISNGNTHIMGVMIESNLIPGNQPYTPGKNDPKELKYGVSITDECIGLEDTTRILDMLAIASKTRGTVMQTIPQ